MARRRPLLYDATGKPIPARASGWDASGAGRRTRGWHETLASLNALLAGDVEALRPRVRNEIRRNPWAKKAMAVFVANAVGKGITPKLKLEDKDLRRQVMDVWKAFVDEADADGTCDFFGLQALAARSMREGGDCFIRFRPRLPSDGLAVPLQLQLLEAEMCDASRNEVLGNGHLVKAGIEFDAVGRRTAYWMFREHPGEAVRSFSMSFESVPVPAAQIAALFQVLRPGQVRGVPELATVLADLHEIRETDDAYILRKKIQNFFTTWEEVPADEGSVLDTDDDEIGDEDVPMPLIEPGTHTLLPPGHEIKHSTPPMDSGDHEAFIRTKLRGVSAGSGVLYEHISGDLSNVTFSSIRAGLIELRRELEQIQSHVLIFQLCRPVWRRFVEAAVLAGKIPVLRGDELAKLLRPQWQPPGWEYVEPEKDVKAAVRRIRAGLSSRERESAKLGIDVEELDIEIAADNERARELGLVFDSDPSSDADGQARAAAVGGAGDSGEPGEAGEGGQAAA